VKWFHVIHLGWRMVRPHTIGDGVATRAPLRSKMVIRGYIGNSTVFEIATAWTSGGGTHARGWQLTCGLDQRRWFAKRWQAMEHLRQLDAVRRLGIAP